VTSGAISGGAPDETEIDLAQVETPVGVVDLDRAEVNARRVVEYCRAHGLAWRPHVKTHKSTRVARLQLDAGARGLTVATPREAEVMATVCDDILLAYPPVGGAKVARLLALPESVRLSVALDSADVLDPLARAAAARAREIDILVEVDAGLRRVGIADPARVAALARRTDATAGVRFAGLLF
jgi:D-serine deaminase-like pyridoxal phosphate-dependent protein